MDDLPSLTRLEAENRTALIRVARYDIAIDVTGMLTGPDFRAVATSLRGTSERLTAVDRLLAGNQPPASRRRR